MAKPLTEAERERIADLLRAGKTVREVRDETGRGLGTIYRVAQAEDIDLGRSEVKTATDAKLADIRARMTRLADGLTEDAERLRAQLFAPHTAYSFGGRDNVYSEHEINEPSPRDKQALLTSIGIAVDKVRQITESQDDKAGLSAVDQWLEDLIRRGRT